jgi:hypothetical protein
MSADNADKDSSQKSWSERIGELGPAWITAIVGLIAVLGGGGYVAGHVSGTRDPTPQPTVTVTATVTAAATVTAQAAQSQQSPHASQNGPSNGAVLGSYTVDLPAGYSIPLGASKPTQSQFDSSEQNGDLNDNGGYYEPLGSDQMVQLPNGSTLTYRACTSSTAFTGGITVSTTGVAFCVLENGKIAGVEVVSESSLTSDYILQVIVWRNIS